MNIQLRLMEEADLTGVVAIENRWSYLSKWGWAGFRSVLQNPWLYFNLVAEDLDYVGPTACQPAEGENPEDSSIKARPASPFLAGFAVLSMNPDHCELCDLVVLPEYLSLGVGQTLLNRCLDICRERKAAALFLEVRHSNQRAIHFYQKNGLQILSCRKAYYNNPAEDAWVMKKAL
jgi:ribosomal-protein-alanine acetyltransferase